MNTLVKGTDGLNALLQSGDNGEGNEPQRSNDPFAGTFVIASKAMSDAEKGTQLVNGAATSMTYVLCVNWHNVCEAEGEATKNNPAFTFPFTVADYCEPDFLKDQADEGQRKRMKASATKALLYRMAGLDPDDIKQSQKQCLLRAVPVANGIMERVGSADDLSISAKGNLRVPGHIMLEKPAADAKDSEVENYERLSALPYVIDGTTGKNGNRTFAALQRAVAPDKNEGQSGQGKARDKAASRLDVVKAWIGDVKIGADRSGMDWVAWIATELDGEQVLEALLGYMGNLGDDDAQRDYEVLCGVTSEESEEEPVTA